MPRKLILCLSLVCASLCAETLTRHFDRATDVHMLLPIDREIASDSYRYEVSEPLSYRSLCDTPCPAFLQRPARAPEPLTYFKHGYRIAYFPRAVGTLVVRLRPAKPSPLFRGLEGDRAEVLRTVDVVAGLASYELRKPPRELVEYLAIGPRALLDDMGDLLAEKRSRGLTAATLDLATIAAKYRGKDLQEKTRNAIRDYYSHAGLRYVLLVGNSYAILPFRAVPVDADGSVVNSDQYYACLSEDSYFGCEVAVGRAPVSTHEEARVFVRKTLAMAALPEKDPRVWNVINVGERADAGTTFGRQMHQLLVGGKVGDWVTRGYGPLVNATKMYEPIHSPYYFTNWQMVQTINQNEPYTLNHIGHCWTRGCAKLDFDYMKKLNNVLPYFAVTGGCFAGDLAAPNWAAQLVLTPRGGAGAVVANSHVGIYYGGSGYSPNVTIMQSFYDSIFREHITQLGPALLHAKEKLISAAFADPRGMRFFFLETNLMGDPELSLKFH